MNEPLDQELRRSYEALETPPTAALERRILDAVRARSASRPTSGRKLALLAATLVIAVAVAWAVRSLPPKAEPVKESPPEPTKERPQEPPRPEEIAARVNGEVLLWKDVQGRLSGIKPSDMTEELRKSARSQLAEELLIRQFAARKGLSVTDAEVEAAVQVDVRTYGSLDQVERMARIRYGTMTRYREARRQDYVIHKAFGYIVRSWQTDPEMRDLKLRTEGVPEEQLRKYYDTHAEQFSAIERISFMRIGVDMGNAGGAQTKRAILESVQRKLEKGGEFPMLAFFYSDVRRAKDFRDNNVSRKDLEGFYSPETIRYLFDELNEGAISPIVQDGRTLNLFKMEQKIRQKAESFEEAQSKIREMLENRIREENRKKTMDWLRSHARIEPADLFGEQK